MGGHAPLKWHLDGGISGIPYTESRDSIGPVNSLSLTQTPTLTERVHAAIQQAILTGELPAGSRLTQEDLAAQLAVSRQPVLQALRLLRRDGFVVDAPAKGFSREGLPRGTRGVMVSPLDARHIRQIYQVRAALDALAVRTAASNGARLPRTLIAQGRQAARSGDIAAMIEADAAYHEAIYAASGNPYIAESAQRHWHPIRRAMGAVLKQHDARAAVWDEHAALSQAIARGDVTTAERLAHEHAERAGEMLAGRLEALAADAIPSPLRIAPIKEST